MLISLFVHHQQLGLGLNRFDALHNLGKDRWVKDEEESIRKTLKKNGILLNRKKKSPGEHL